MADDVVLRVEVVDDTDSPGGGPGVTPPPQPGTFVDQQGRLRDARGRFASSSVAGAEAAKSSLTGGAQKLAQQRGASFAVPPTTGGEVVRQASTVSGAVSGAAALVGLASAATVATGALVAFRKSVQLLNQEAETAARYNARVAMAQAAGEIARVQGDIRRANEASIELSEFVRSRDALQETLRDIRTDILRTIAPAITDTLFGVNAILEILETLSDAASKGFGLSDNAAVIAEVLGQGIKSAFGLGVYAQFRSAVKIWYQNQKKEEAKAQAGLGGFYEFIDPEGFKKQMAARGIK